MNLVRRFTGCHSCNMTSQEHTADNHPHKYMSMPVLHRTSSVVKRQTSLRLRDVLVCRSLLLSRSPSGARPQLLLPGVSGAIKLLGVRSAVERCTQSGGAAPGEGTGSICLIGRWA